MRKLISYHWVFILLFLLLTIFLTTGIDTIPFHPDESTYLYMSGDLDIYLSNPIKLSFDIQNDDDPQQRYRLIDPPLTRYALGIGRMFSRTPPLVNDWDWSKTWEENLLNQAMPSNALLNTGRMAMTIFLLLSIILLYFIGSYIGGRSSGILAASILGVNALVLLHGRRAMAEGVLIFGITFFLYSLLYSSRRPWLTGLGMAIAFNAKHSTLPLLPLGILAVCWIQEKSERSIIRIITNISIYLCTFILVTSALNPVFWHQPINAVQTAILKRQDLLTLQVSATSDIMPERVLDTNGKKITSLIANLYILPPSVADVGNYLTNTSISEENYFSIPGNKLFRGLIGGGLMLVLTINGLILSGLHLSTQLSRVKKASTLYLLATFLQIIGLLLFLPIPVQRYVIPLVPFVCLWIGYGLGQLFTQTSHNLTIIRLKK